MKREGNRKPQWFFWVMLGPLTLFFPFLVLFHQKNLPFFSLFSFSPLGIFFSWQAGKKGALFSSLFLLGMAFFVLYPLSFEECCWGWGIVLTIVLSLFITSLASEEVHELVESLEKESKNRLHHLVRLDEKYQQFEKKWRQKLDQETNSQQKQIAFLHQQLQQAQQEALRRKQSVNLEKQLRKMEGLYQQLREQFVEKSRVLSETRRELFYYREKETLLEREWKENEKAVWAEWETMYIDLSQKWEEERNQERKGLFMEIDLLHELISHLGIKEDAKE